MTPSWTADLATHVNELSASMRNDATALEDVSGILHAAIDDITHDYDHEKARRIANRITAATTHAMALIAALQRNTGRFEAMAQCVELGEADAPGGR